MEDADGLSFDFEGGLDSGPVQNTASVPVAPPENSSSAAVNVAPTYDHSSATVAGAGRGRSFRQTVCRHWLRGLCMKGDACGFLHQFDKARMPICRFFRLYGECREQDCVYKHTNEDIKECNMYKLGFCPNGPDCRYRHAKLPGPPPPVEEVLQKIQQLTTYNYGTNRLYQARNVAPQLQDRPQGQVPMQGQPQESGNLQQQQQQQPQQSQHQVSQTLIPNPADQTNRTSHPLPQGVNRYFVVKSNNRENFELSVQQGVWATQRSNEAKLNEAFDSVENVILIFSVNRTRHFQGCAKMTSRIGGYIGGGNWKHEHGTAQYGRNFSVKWLKLCELSFHKTRNLRNPYNENLPVKISRDCQELEPSVGEQLASLLYLEPDSELMAISIAAEAKREEEKAKGVNPESRAENPDIVPFEDNEEEEEEEDESEEEEESMAGGPQGRGRGRGIMWPPQMPLGRGIRPMPGMGGFPLGVMGPGDAFPYGPGGYNGMPDPFGMGPRPFGPYGPRFGGDFRGPVPGMMFPGRPPQQFPHGGYGMMGGGRGPHMGGMGNAPRGGRPMYYPPATSSARPGPSNRKTPERSDERGVSGDQQNQDASHDMEQFEVGNSLRNEESESEDEDEAPRRSRHGEGKKRR
ncbi:30-kDa cleavage and polyadenylation specificity factor 30 [Arabidopsis thaliana]|uniref:30-kDa cleavage and polyadenylation specificity factor 30 n=4 Tax=Arabidopsis TaxID=3701 RepID=CPSF_ARATH|nr:cleavage and polyadenylation specificity factor 30 [Arabidopsis thaliana]A9LNK9.1 RecName: Full=30-kDa cleavage and polyadenylation specificity factor 30; AltName: Full=Protein OXIDATIVE STRESS TOLERANT 6; AltName: Full=Zinc finger CCCH domain-containing protein 11; Short=AtC3H11 [Arabidopsis thaliana]KAG7648030.1 YTH domain [Arabidopsis thaliana x Arabidopsis arenosa]ABX26048.1 cleavage and polyadenylation specificity factor-YT521B [Arabidopsis thaliana]AEE31221.1 cleavage and polyadenylati|eukprot:NP_174334.2 cleavage and polyadenylation specificity factor 30 [Arabidopsis thaliana]